MLSLVYSDEPAVSVTHRLSDIGVVHSAVASRTQDDEVLGREALRRRALGQVEEVVNLAVTYSVPLHEAKFAAELTSGAARPFHIPCDRAGSLVGLQFTMNLPQHLRSLRLRLQRV